MTHDDDGEEMMNKINDGYDLNDYQCNHYNKCCSFVKKKHKLKK